MLCHRLLQSKTFILWTGTKLGADFGESFSRFVASRFGNTDVVNVFAPFGEIDGSSGLVGAFAHERMVVGR